MRVIHFLLALANLRWAGADLDRSIRLHALADEALAMAQRRRDIADGFARRCGLSDGKS